jgi:hypothetical protein
VQRIRERLRAIACASRAEEELDEDGGEMSGDCGGGGTREWLRTLVLQQYAEDVETLQAGARVRRAARLIE